MNKRIRFYYCLIPDGKYSRFIPITVIRSSQLRNASADFLRIRHPYSLGVPQFNPAIIVSRLPFIAVVKNELYL